MIGCCQDRLRTNGRKTDKWTRFCGCRYEKYPTWAGKARPFTYTNWFEFGWYSCPTCPPGGWDCSNFTLESGAEMSFVCHLILNSVRLTFRLTFNQLPRQARDKHRRSGQTEGTTQKRDVFFVKTAILKRPFPGVLTFVAVGENVTGKSVAEVNRTMGCYSKYLIDTLNISVNQLVNPATRKPLVPPGCVGFSAVYDCGAEPYRTHLLQQLKAVMANLAEYSGGIVIGAGKHSPLFLLEKISIRMLVVEHRQLPRQARDKDKWESLMKRVLLTVCFVDRWDFVGLTNANSDDGVTAYINPESGVKKAMAIRSTTISLQQFMESVSEVVHTQYKRAVSINGKYDVSAACHSLENDLTLTLTLTLNLKLNLMPAGWLAGWLAGSCGAADHTYRIDILKNVDNAGDEHGSAAARVHAGSLAFMSKPVTHGRPKPELLYWGSMGGVSSTAADWQSGALSFARVVFRLASRHLTFFLAGIRRLAS